MCAGALAVIDAIERGGLLARAVALGESLFGAAAAAAPEGTVLEARGRGCLWGFQLARPVANDVVLAMIDGGGMLANGFANWNDAGVVVEDSGCTVNGAASEF